MKSLLLIFALALPNQSLKENLDLPYNAEGESKEEEDAPEIIEFYGHMYEGDGIAYVIDRSFSMQDSGELETAKREVSRNIGEFGNRVYFGVVFFDADLLRYPPSGNPTQASPSTKQSAGAWVSAMTGGRGSCCQQGIVAGLDLVNKAPVRHKTVIYVGDGGGTCQGAGEEEYHKQTLSVVKGRNYQHVQINCIGVLMRGRESQRQFLQKLARMNNGTYTEVVR